MGMPVIDINPIDRDNAINNIIASIALQEAGLSHILNAEGEKIEKMAATTGITPEQLLAANASVGTLLGNAQEYENRLADKLSVAYTGIAGAAGPTGATGDMGITGASAYDIWLQAGNTGSEASFTAGLQGPTGATGEAGAAGPTGDDGRPGDRGATGEAGTTGASAYDIWVGIGNPGTTGEFLASLVGPTGPDGVTGPTGDVPPTGYPLKLPCLTVETSVVLLPETGSLTISCTAGYVAAFGYFHPDDNNPGTYNIISSYPPYYASSLGLNWTLEYALSDPSTPVTGTAYAFCTTGELYGGE
jgi:hypothetical protein